MLEDYDQVIADFWKHHKPVPEDGWRIATKIVQEGGTRWFKATIFYSGTSIITAHSDDFSVGDVTVPEKQAIARAIMMLPK